MKGSMVKFRANGGTASGYLTLPKSGKGPGLLVLQEWWGLMDHIKQVADRFASKGYVVLAPDLYKGEKSTHPDEAARLMMSMNMAETAKSLRGAAQYLLAHECVTPKKVAAMGFCMGGQLALFTATEHPDVVHAVVDFYGIFNPNVPVDISRLQSPVLAHFGKHDEYIPVEKAEALIDDIESTGVPIEAHFYDAGHAFFNDSRPEAYHEKCADLAFRHTLAFLERTIL